MAASAWPGWAQEEPSCPPKPSFTDTRPRGRSKKVQRHLEIHPFQPLPTSCFTGFVSGRASGCAPQQCISSTGWDDRVQRMRLLLSPRLMFPKRGVFQPREMASAVLENDSAQGFWQLFLQLPHQSHNPRIFSCYCSLLCYSSLRDQGEWQWMKY